jgi:hypothetical protein
MKHGTSSYTKRGNTETTFRSGVARGTNKQANEKGKEDI